MTVANTSHSKVRETATNPRYIESAKIWLISLLGYWAIRLIGGTLRWQVEGWENLRSIQAANKNTIYTFWHGRIFMGTYFFRNLGIVVMTSQNQDGEYIARVIQRFGYGVARGSSTRGSTGALVEMIRELRNKHDVAFSIDGPTGPRYVAKPGAVWIASKTGDAVFPFNLSAEKKWVLNSWDHFQIPKPFSRVLVLMGAPIYVKENATEAELEDFQRQLQHSLEDLLYRSDAHWETPKIKTATRHEQQKS
ncbi:MAG: lysophospholipid acyltransferase family protein [Acidobacteriota bacterium]|jgi:hypothetical protein